MARKIKVGLAGLGSLAQRGILPHTFQDDARDRYEGAPWFALAAQFADDWDQIAFDPDYDTRPLEHFEPLVRQQMARGRIVIPS